MKKLLLIISCLFMIIGNIFAEDSEVIEENKKVEDSYGYFTLSFGIPAILGLNLGYRMQKHHNGFEIGGGITPLIWIYEGHGFLSYLYYPNPKLDAQFYFGLGARGGYANVTGKGWHKGGAGYGALGLIFGKSYVKQNHDKRFFQIGVSPVAFISKGVYFAPSINVSYGLCF